MVSIFYFASMVLTIRMGSCPGEILAQYWNLTIKYAHIDVYFTTKNNIGEFLTFLLWKHNENLNELILIQQSTIKIKIFFFKKMKHLTNTMDILPWINNIYHHICIIIYHHLAKLFAQAICIEIMRFCLGSFCWL